MSKRVTGWVGGLGLVLLLVAALVWWRRPGPDEVRWQRIPGGVASIGSRAPGGWPPQTVTVTPFRVSATEITVAQYRRFAPATPGDPRSPVTGLSQRDAVVYCAWLSQQLGTTVRLPTEIEWEHAARGGGRGAPYPWGWAAPTGRAWFGQPGPTAVGRFAPNAYGLYDLVGNVAEWCAPAADLTNQAVARGGSFADRDPARLQIHRRVPFPLDYRDADVGFRVARVP